mgnify:FL=1
MTPMPGMMVTPPPVVATPPGKEEKDIFEKLQDAFGTVVLVLLGIAVVGVGTPLIISAVRSSSL